MNCSSVDWGIVSLLSTGRVVNQMSQVKDKTDELTKMIGWIWNLE